MKIFYNHNSLLYVASLTHLAVVLQILWLKQSNYKLWWKHVRDRKKFKSAVKMIVVVEKKNIVILVEIGATKMH